jgi:hypothetical protein
MKVYTVWPDRYDYDQYDCIVVIAENEKRALEIAQNNKYFHSNQGYIHVDEEDMTQERVICESFNAG